MTQAIHAYYIGLCDYKVPIQLIINCISRTINKHKDSAFSFFTKILFCCVKISGSERISSCSSRLSCKYNDIRGVSASDWMNNYLHKMRIIC